MAFSVQVHPSASQIQGGNTVNVTITASGHPGWWGFNVTSALTFDGIVSGAVRTPGGLGLNSQSLYTVTGSTAVVRLKSQPSQNGAFTIAVVAETSTFGGGGPIGAYNFNKTTGSAIVTVTPHPDYAALPAPTNFRLAARTDVVADRLLKARGTWDNISVSHSYLEVETRNAAGISTVQSNYQITNTGSTSAPSNDNFYFPAFATTYQVRVRFVRESPAATGAWSSFVTFTTEAQPTPIGNASNPAAIASVDLPEIRVSCTVPRLIVPANDPRYNKFYLSANIYRATSELGTYSYNETRAAVASTNNQSSTIVFTDTECQYDTEYFYKIKACLPGLRLFESSAFTSVVSATTVPAPGPPTAPTVTLEVDSWKQITLSWAALSSNVKFLIRRATIAGGPYTELATIPAGSTDYVDNTLSPSTTYYYIVRAINAYGNADSTEVSATTDIAPDEPEAPTELQASALSANSVRLIWTASEEPVTSNPSGNAPEFYDIQRSTTEGGPYTVVDSVDAAVTTFLDGSVAELTTYYYVVTARNAGGSSDESNEAEVTTPERPVTLLQDLGYTFTVGAMTKIIQVAQRVMFWSSRNRMVVWAGRKSFKGGLKPQLVAPAVALGSSGGLTGRFKAYVKLLRNDGLTPSRPSPASVTIEPDNEKVTITPQVDPDDPTRIHCRDRGFDSSGLDIPGCDFYEIYLWDLDGAQGYPNYVVTLPITTLSYTTSATFNATALARGKHMTDFEEMLPPAGGIAEYDAATNRTRVAGEESIKPTADEIAEASAAGNTIELDIEAGDTQCEISNWTTPDPDALIHKELILNHESTGWFVEDVDTDEDPAVVYLRHPDLQKHEAGFAGANGPYTDFSFAANPSRIYMSRFGTTSDSEIAYQPETFPPRYLEGELNPDDNQNPNGMVSSRDVMFITKPNSSFYTIGGAGTDEDEINGFPQVVNVSRGSGLLAQRTLCRDRFDVVYGLNDQGPFTLRQSGVQNVGESADVAWLLQRYYDVSTADGAVGCFFQRENYFIVCGLNRKGRTGNRDWFIYDTRNNAVLPQTFPTKITCLLPTHTDSGETQLLYGDETGSIGVLLRMDSHVDGTNFTLANPTDAETPIQCTVTTGVVSPTYGFSPDLFRPHIKIDNQSENVTFVLDYDSMNRSGDASAEFVASKSKSFTIRTDRNPDHIALPRRECQSARFRLSFTSPRNSQVRIANMEIEALEHGG